MTRQIAIELLPVVKQLQAEGRDIYTYSFSDDENKEITGLFWYENGRVLDIQSNSWRHYAYARDRYDLGVCYIPSRENGSGCGLTQGINDCGTPACDLLPFRNHPTWVKGIVNYKNMDEYVKKAGLTYFKIDTQ